MLDLRDLSKRWGEFEHDRVNLSIEQGELFVLLGPSGAGKTLLLEMIAGFHLPDAGCIRIKGKDVTRLAPEKRNAGFVYQEQMLFPHKSVRQNLAYGLEARKQSSKSIAAKLDYLAHLLHLEGLLDRSALQLSIGQRQRVSLGRALAIDPDVLLLDEPFSSLDPVLRERMALNVQEIQRQTGITTLLVTHDRDEARLLGHRIGIIRAGRIEQTGNKDDIFGFPESRFVAEFTGGYNVYSGTSEQKGDLWEFQSGVLQIFSSDSITGDCVAMVRPENIIISRERIAASARNQLPVVVESIARRGETCRVAALVSGEPIAGTVTSHSVEEMDLQVGQEVYFSFKASDVRLFREGLDV